MFLSRNLSICLVVAVACSSQVHTQGTGSMTLFEGEQAHHG